MMFPAKPVRSASGTLFLVALLTVLVANPATASDEHPAVAKGLENPTGYTFGGLDSVNIFSGALGLSIPIGGSFQVSPALSYQVGLSWMHAPWQYDGMSCAPGPGCPDSNPNTIEMILVDPDERSNSGLGWRLSLPELVSPPQNGATVWNLLEPDGTKRIFSNELWVNVPPTTTPGVWYSVDGSFHRLKLDQSTCTTPGLATCHTVELPTGATYEFETTFRTVAGAQALRLHRLRRIVDKFGHYVQIDYDGVTKDWTITDSVGRSHLVEVSADPFESTFERIDAVKLAAFGGTEATWTFNYDPAGFSLDLPGSMPTVADTFSQLDGVTLPDGNEFAFSYDADFNIEQVDLPTGGHYSYQYGGWNVGPNPPPNEPLFPFIQAVTGVVSRTENDGSTGGGTNATWTYEHPVIFSFIYHQTNVVTPEGDLTVHYFSTERPTSGLPMAYCAAGDCFDAPATALDTASNGGTVYLSRQEYDGATAVPGQLRRSVYLAYTGNSQFSDGNGQATFSRSRSPRIVAEKTIFHDDSDGVAETFYEDYDGLGHHRAVRLEGTFFGDTDHWNKRLTTTDHNSNSSLDCPWGFQTACTGTAVVPAVGSPWLLELLSDSRTKVWKNNSGSTQTFIQKMCFDGATGFLEGRRSVAGTGLECP